MFAIPNITQASTPTGNSAGLFGMPSSVSSVSSTPLQGSFFRVPNLFSTTLYYNVAGGGGGTITGSGANNQITYWTGATTISGDANNTWDYTQGIFALKDPATSNTTFLVNPITDSYILGNSGSGNNYTYNDSTAYVLVNNNEYLYSYNMLFSRVTTIGERGKLELFIDPLDNLGYGTNALIFNNTASGNLQFLVSDQQAAMLVGYSTVNVTAAGVQLNIVDYNNPSAANLFLTADNTGKFHYGDTLNNKTSIDIDDVAQTINFNSQYNFPFLDATVAGYVLSSDAAGTLSWVAQSVGGNETLAQTLVLGNTTGGRNIIMTAGDYLKSSTGNTQVDLSGSTYVVTTDNGGFGTPYQVISTTQIELAGLSGGGVILSNSSLSFAHNTLIQFSTAPVRFNALTASTVPYLDASKNLVSSAVTPTQLSYLDATSSIQTQINTKQDLDADLTAIAALGFVSTSFLKKTAANTWALDTNTYLTSVGTGVQNELTYWATTSTLGSLATATYPNLTELSYVKGVTSAIQTQINNKQTLATNLTSLSGLSYVSSSFVKMSAAGTFILDTSTYLTTAITSLNALTGATQTFTNDTNVTIVSGGTAHVITWSGTLADGRIASATNWNTAYTQTRQWDGGSTGLVAATGRTSLGLVIGTDILAYRTFGTAANNATGDFFQVANNLSEGTASTMRTNLGLVIGTNVQAYDTDLQAIAALTSAADKMPYATGAGTWAMTDLTSFARTILDDTTAAGVRTTIGAGTGNGDALVANPLSQFASTTSLQLRGVLSDENGTGVALFNSSTSATFITPILGTPTSVTLTNATGLPLTTGLTGGNWKTIYTNGSGVITELALPTTGKVLTGNGTANPPTWETPSISTFDYQQILFSQVFS